eukprot:1090438-Alexandrium_andersonii.AAC.1
MGSLGEEEGKIGQREVAGSEGWGPTTLTKMGAQLRGPGPFGAAYAMASSRTSGLNTIIDLPS